MTTNHQDLLLLRELLVQIRGIAGDAAGRNHVSTIGGGHFNAEQAVQAIYDLADAAHNIPQALADGPGEGAYFLLVGSREQVAAIGVELFGERSTFEAHMPLHAL